MKLDNSVIKQLIFDCAVELLHETEGLSNEQIADKLLYIVKNLDGESSDTEQ